MKPIPTPLNNEERFFYAIAERLDAILDTLKTQEKPKPQEAPKPVKEQTPQKPKRARKPKEG